MARVLGREGVDPKVSRSFYTAVTQQVLLFGAETCVLTRKMESALDVFQGRVARRLTGRQPFRERDGRWFYPSLAGAMKEAGMVRIRPSHHHLAEAQNRPRPKCEEDGRSEFIM